MMAIVEDLAAARTAMVYASTKLRAIVDGPATGPDSLVETEGGPVRTEARRELETLGGWQIKTADYQAVAWDRLQPDTTGGSITVTLPVDPTAGTEVWFSALDDSWETNPLTVDPGDEEIDGFDEPVEFTVPDDFVFRFSGTSWRLI